MASDLPSSGTIKFSEIQEEFGSISGGTNKRLGSYRGPFGYGNLRLPLDDGMPLQGSSIKFSDFYGKELNIVVDLYSGNPETRVNASSIYNSKGICVGPASKNPPSRGGGKKVIVHVNKLIGSKKGNVKYCALRTGSDWKSGTELSVDVGTEGMIVGAGGAGGYGSGSPGYNGLDGENGTSGLGVEYDGTVVNVRGANVTGGDSGQSNWEVIWDMGWNFGHYPNSGSNYYKFALLTPSWSEISNVYEETVSYVKVAKGHVNPSTTTFSYNGGVDSPSGSVEWYGSGVLVTLEDFYSSYYNNVTAPGNTVPGPGNNFRYRKGDLVTDDADYNYYKIIREKYEPNESTGTYEIMFNNGFNPVAYLPANESTSNVVVGSYKYTIGFPKVASGSEGDFYKIQIEQNTDAGGTRGGGAIMCGYGGGGGGGAGSGWDNNCDFWGCEGEWRTGGGGGGGGGAGYPQGTEGFAYSSERTGAQGQPGQIPYAVYAEGAGTNVVTGGAGGIGGDSKGEGEGGLGGYGGSNANSATRGLTGRGEGWSTRESGGGYPGGNGAAIRVKSGCDWVAGGEHNSNRIYGDVNDSGVK